MARTKSKTTSQQKRRGQSGSSEEGQRLTIRLLGPLNDIVRRGALYRGDISKTISTALLAVDLNQVKAIDLENAGELAKSTTIVIDEKAFAKLEHATKTRGASMNLLINSALAHKFGYPPKEKSRS